MNLLQDLQNNKLLDYFCYIPESEYLFTTELEEALINNTSLLELDVLVGHPGITNRGLSLVTKILKNNKNLVSLKFKIQLLHSKDYYNLDHRVTDYNAFVKIVNPDRQQYINEFSKALAHSNLLFLDLSENYFSGSNTFTIVCNLPTSLMGLDLSTNTVGKLLRNSDALSPLEEYLETNR